MTTARILNVITMYILYVFATVFLITCWCSSLLESASSLIVDRRILYLKDPSHPLCFARFEDDMRHFQCHRNSSFLQCEFKSFYILPNTAHSGLNSPSTCSQTISGFIYWIICELFVIFRKKSVTQTRECNRTSFWFESQLKQHSRSSIESSLEDLLDYFLR